MHDHVLGASAGIPQGLTAAKQAGINMIVDADTFLVSKFFDTLPEAAKNKLAADNPYGFLYIHEYVLPKLRELGVSEKVINGICVDNPRNFFEGK